MNKNWVLSTISTIEKLTLIDQCELARVVVQLLLCIYQDMQISISKYQFSWKHDENNNMVLALKMKKKVILLEDEQRKVTCMLICIALRGSQSLQNISLARFELCKIHIMLDRGTWTDGKFRIVGIWEIPYSSRCSYIETDLTRAWTFTGYWLCLVRSVASGFLITLRSICFDFVKPRIRNHCCRQKYHTWTKHDVPFRLGAAEWSTSRVVWGCRG